MGSQSEDVSITETNNISTEETSRGTRTDEPVQLIEFVRAGNGSDGNTTIQLKHDTISSLVEKAGNRPLSVICICGPSRQGKSFMLGYMIRCLEAMEKEETDWMDWDDKKKKLEGFNFRNGTKPETQGIWVWSRPFIVKNEEDKEIAVLLIDTQGTYDEFTSNKDMSAIVGLSLLSSSVMIFNLFTNLQEDVLASLTTYTSYGQLALDNTNDDSSPFQKLVFLIRDWNNPWEYAYGARGGKKFLEEQLKVKPDQPPETRQVRESVRKCFKDVDCFLMPQIGEKAFYPTFAGLVDELAPNFAKKMEDFINGLISSETLVTKEILGCEVTASELVSYLQNYIDIFNSNEVPSAKSMWDASTDVHNSHMVRKATQKFHDLIKKKLRGNNYLQTEDLEKAMNAAFKQALELFRKARKFGGPERIQEYQDDLEKTLEKDGKELMKQNEEKRKKYLAAVVTDATVKFRTCLEDDISFDNDGNDSITFYEDNVIRRAIQQAKDSAINELKEKMESEDEETIHNQIVYLLLILDETISFYEYKNKAHRTEAEKKIMGIVDKLSTEFDEKLKEFHENNQFADINEVKWYHQTNITFIMECWKKAKKPGKKEFHKKFDAKLEKELTNISSRFENQHKVKFQDLQNEADERVSTTARAYEDALTEKGEHVDMEEQIHEELLEIILTKFAEEDNPYPAGHMLHEQLNAVLEGELQTIFEYVKREVIQIQQKMEESYRDAVEHALKYYEMEMKEILSTNDFMSEEDLQVEHKRIFEETLNEYESFQKIGVPDNALNFKVEFVEKLKQRFEEIRANNQRNHDLAVSKAANCVSDCHRKYEEFMKLNVVKMLSNLHREAILFAKEMFFENCPAREDQEFVAKYERDLDANIEYTFGELKNLLEMKREQKESQVKIKIADCRKLLHDEMQKHCKTSSFIRRHHQTVKCKMATGKQVGGELVPVRNAFLLPISKLVDQKFQFYFLLDTSTSMRGTNIELAKHALMLFLQSLPEDSFFNIVTFNKLHTTVFPASVKYSQHTLEQAKSAVEGFNCKFGTELYAPLKYVYSCPQIPGYLTQIFTITDGAVSNRSAVLELVRSMVKHSRSFSLGIGDHVDKRFVQGIAENAGGTYEFITQNEKIESKILNQLKIALKPA